MPAELVGSNATRETVGCQSFPGFILSDTSDATAPMTVSGSSRCMSPNVDEHVHVLVSDSITRPANHRYTVTTDRMRRVCSPRVRCPPAVPPADTADIYASVGNSDT